MQPTIWQLKQRIKFVKEVRDGTYTFQHNNYQNGCFVCAVGAGMRSGGIEIRKKIDPILQEMTCMSPAFWNNSARSALRNKLSRAVLEMNQLVDAYGINFLEWREIEHFYEGCKPYTSKHTENQMIDKFEREHVLTYLWMINGHYERIKRNIGKELATS